MDQMPSSVKALKETQSTEPSHTESPTDLILSSSTIGLRGKGVVPSMLPLHHASSLACQHRTLNRQNTRSGEGSTTERGRDNGGTDVNEVGERAVKVRHAEVKERKKWSIPASNCRNTCTHIAPPPFYSPFPGTNRVSWCQKKASSGLYGAREDNKRQTQR